MSVYEIVTDRIIQALEAGVVPWHQPWKVGQAMNLVSKKPYRGVNPLILSLQNRKSPYWVSYKQLIDLGGTLKPDDKKASMVIFWKWMDTKEKDDEGEMVKIPLLRYYNVFNLDQIDGIEAPKEEKLEFTPVEMADKIITGYTFRNGPSFLEAGDRACYSPTADMITMPAKESFDGVGEYYSTLFHEMTHSTGHKSRLARKEVVDVNLFGSDDYAQEELVAEIGSSFLQAETGIESVHQNSEAYIGNWIKVLKNDKKFVILSAAKAQRAVDLILNRKFEGGGDQ